MTAKFQAISSDGASCFISGLLTHDALSAHRDWHYHPEWELCYIKQGCGSRYMGDDVGRFSTGDLLIIGPNVPHALVFDSSESVDDNEIILVQFRADSLGQEFLAIPEMRVIRDFADQEPLVASLYGVSAQQVKSLLKDLQSGSGLRRLITFFKIIEKLLDCSEFTVLSRNIKSLDTAQSRMEKIDSYIRLSLGSDICQVDVATLVAMTPQAFSRFFRAATGGTFTAYVNTIRVDEACQLLLGSDEKIVDIAHRCGYKNLSGFYHRFSELKQCTPKEYRDRPRPPAYNVS